MRPLTATELTHALAVDPDDTELDEDNIISVDLLTEYCEGLVVVEPGSDIVRFVHYTTQEYFASLKNDELFAGADRNIALCCITFLSFDDPFLEDDCILQEIKTVFKATPFLKYAAVQFGAHYHKMLSQPPYKDSDLPHGFSEVLCRFFQSPPKVHRAAASALYQVLGQWQAHHRVRNLDVSAMDLAAYYGIIRADEAELYDSSHLDKAPLSIEWFQQHTKNVTGDGRLRFGNALHWAAIGDSIEFMNLLLEAASLNLDIHESNAWYCQPQHISAVFGSVETLRALLEHGELNIDTRAEFDTDSRSGGEACWAGTMLTLAIAGIGSTSPSNRVAIVDLIVTKDT